MLALALVTVLGGSVATVVGEKTRAYRVYCLGEAVDRVVGKI